jgi:hypothetical protein
MQQHEVSAEQQDLPNSGEVSVRLGFLVRRFRAQILRRDRHDAAVLDGLLRVLRRGGSDVDELCRLIGHRAYACIGTAEVSRTVRETTEKVVQDHLLQTEP